MTIKSQNTTTSLLAVACCCLWHGSLKAEKRPNILWIIADDLGQELSCYGNPDAKTPHMDKLALEGIRYLNAFSTAPTSSPSRSSLITGMYPPSINCHNHRTIDKKELPDGIFPITEYFKQAGYFCTNGDGSDLSKKGKEDYNFTTYQLFDGNDWAQRSPNQPFFAQIQIHEPHRPFVNDKNCPVNPDNIHLPSCYPNLPLLRSDWANYIESIQVCDKLVGQILNRLEEEGLAQNTIVFLFGDNGRPHLRDKQFLYEGGLKVPLIVRWPQKLHPGTVDNRLVSLIDIAATSLAATNIKPPLHMQGKIIFGENSTKRDYILGFRQRAGEALDDIRSISDGRFKLIWNRNPKTPWMQMSGYKKSEYPAYSVYYLLHNQGILKEPYNQFMTKSKPEMELYDLEMDSMELNNLAGNDLYSEIMDELFIVLKEKLQIIEQQTLSESAEAIQQAKEQSGQYYKQSMKSLGLETETTYDQLVEFWQRKLLLKTFETDY